MTRRLTPDIHSLSFGATIADFAKVYEGVGMAFDLNNVGQVLLQDASAGFNGGGAPGLDQ